MNQKIWKKKQILSAAVICVLFVCMFGTTVFAQDYIYISHGGAPVQKVVPGWNRLDYRGETHWYYGDKNGNFLKGWQKIGGKWYAFKDPSSFFPIGRTAGWAAYETGEMYAAGTWAFSENTKKGAAIYSFKKSGELVTGWWHGTEPITPGVKSNNAPVWYYHDSNGRAVEGWQRIGGKWYYFSPGIFKKIQQVIEVFTGCAMQTGWLNDGGKWYYLNSSGAMTTGWQKIGGKWYYMNSSGVMQTGWQKIGGSWYYLEASGSMKTGWLNQNGSWYYMKGSGVMLTGWQKIGGTWYYFKSSGAMAANEWCGGYWLNADGAWTYPYKGSWHKERKGWWFGDTSGWYAKNETIRIDDVYYAFNGQGYILDSTNREEMFWQNLGGSDKYSSGSWKKAYYDFIVNDTYLNYGQTYYTNSDSADEYIDVKLLDMNNDGTPELFIGNGSTITAFRGAYVYTCTGNSVKYLGAVDIGGYSFTDPNYPGLLQLFGRQGYRSAIYYTLENGALKSESVMTGREQVDGAGKIIVVVQSRTSDEKMYQLYKNNAYTLIPRITVKELIASIQ